MGILDDLWQSIVGKSVADAQPAAETPAKSGLGLLGSGWSQQTPIALTPQQYQDASQSLPGVLNSFRGGYLSGLSNLAGGDPRAQAADYNAQLGQAQQVYGQGLGLTVPTMQADYYAGRRDGNGKWIGPGSDPLLSGAAAGNPIAPAQGAPQAPQGLLAPETPQGAPNASGMASGGLLAPQSAAPQPPQNGAAPLPPQNGTAPPQAGGAPAAPSSGNLAGGNLPLPYNMSPFAWRTQEQVNPEAAKAAAAAWYSSIRANSLYRGPDGQLHQAPAGGIPGVSGAPGQPGYNQAVSAFKGAESGGTAGGAYPYNVATHAQNAAADYTLKTGEAPPGAAPVAQASPTRSFGPMAGTTPPAAPPQPVTTTAPPKGAVTAAQASPQVAAFSGKPFVTEKGTVVPPAAGNQKMGPGEDAIGLQNKSSQTVIDGWNANRGNIDIARDRLNLSAKLFSQVEGKGLNEQKAEAANTLRGIPGGKGLADTIMSASDTGAVQLAIWNSMNESLSVLKTINQGTGGRILNSEFNAFMEHGYSPNMNSSALYGALTHQLGQIYQVQNMIDDFPTGQQMNWRDAGQYQRAYLKNNPIEGFVGYAESSTPAFKGMPTSTPIRKWTIKNGKLVQEMNE